MTGKAARQLRLRLALSQERLAKRLGVHRLTVLKWEAGTLTVPESVALVLRLVDKHGWPEGDKK